MKRLAKTAVFLLLLLQLAFSQGTCSMSDEWKTGGWESVSLLAISIVLVFISLVYAANIVFKKPDWSLWVKDEFYQAIVSLAILVAVFGVVGALCDLSSNLTYLAAGVSDSFTSANAYLDDLLWQKTLNLSNNIFLLSVYAEVSAAYAIDLGVVRWFPSAGLNAIAQSLDFLYAIVIGISGSLLLQEIGLQLVKATAFKLILPMGIFLRMFPFTRAAGATLIALAIGLYIILPLTYVMDMLIVDTVYVTYPNLFTTFTLDQNMIYNFFGSTMATLILQYNFTVYQPFQAAMTGVASLLPQALFLPTLNIIITLTFVKTATKVLSQNFAQEFEVPTG